MGTHLVALRRVDDGAVIVVNLSNVLMVHPHYGEPPGGGPPPLIGSQLFLLNAATDKPLVVSELPSEIAEHDTQRLFMRLERDPDRVYANRSLITLAEPARPELEGEGLGPGRTDLYLVGRAWPLRVMNDLTETALR